MTSENIGLIEISNKNCINISIYYGHRFKQLPSVNHYYIINGLKVTLTNLNNVTTTIFTKYNKLIFLCFIIMYTDSVYLL